MPKTQSAKKALRQSRLRTARNQAQKKLLKETIKKFKKLADKENAAETKEQLRLVTRALDKAAKIGLIKRNTADRLKSRLTRKANKKTKAQS